MTLENLEWFHSAAWWILHPSRPCTDPRVRRIIQNARINALTTPDNE